MAGCNSDAASHCRASVFCSVRGYISSSSCLLPPALLALPRPRKTPDIDRADSEACFNPSILDPKCPFKGIYIHSISQTLSPALTDPKCQQSVFVYYQTVWSQRNSIVWMTEAVVWTTTPRTVTGASHLVSTDIPR